MLMNFLQRVLGTRPSKPVCQSSANPRPSPRIVLLPATHRLGGGLMISLIRPKELSRSSKLANVPMSDPNRLPRNTSSAVREAFPLRRSLEDGCDERAALAVRAVEDACIGGLEEAAGLGVIGCVIDVFYWTFPQ